MPTITPSVVRISGNHGLDGYQITWAAMKNGDVGAPIGSVIAGTPAAGGGMTGFADKTIQIASGSTLGVGGAVTAEGSNDAGTSWGQLTDPVGSLISLTQLGQIKAITEAPAWTRPRVTAGDANTTITVVMFVRATQWQ